MTQPANPASAYLFGAATNVGGKSQGIQPVHLGQGPGAPIPPTQSGLTHAPYLFLFDVSGSMGAGPQPDIVEVERMADTIIKQLANAPTHGAIIEIAITAYSDEVKLLQPWTHVAQASLPPLKAEGGTRMGTALLGAIDYAERRKRYYKTYPGQPINYSAPHIFHFTDGAPTDMTMGDELWTEVQQLITGFSPSPEKDPYQSITHFVAPNGQVPGHNGFQDQNGQPISGKEALVAWTSSETVFELNDSTQMFANLSDVIVKSVTGHTRQAGTIHAMLKKFGGNTLRSGSAVSGSKSSGGKSTGSKGA